MKLLKSKRFTKGIIFLLSIIFLSSCVAEIDPISGKRTYTLLSTEQEIEIGKRIVPHVIKEYNGLYPDREVQQYVRDLGFRVAKESPRKVSYEFYVLNSPVINAFALPGGPVFVTKGLLSILESESELVGVLAHEVGHITARHHAKFLEKTFGINMLLNILNIALYGSDQGALVMELAKISAALLKLKFSRDQENEADSLGVRLTYQAGYDPRGIISVFRKFKELERGRPVEWLSTHPLPETRIKNVETMIQRNYPDSDRLRKNSESFRRIKEVIRAKKSSQEALSSSLKLEINEAYFLTSTAHIGVARDYKAFPV